VPILRTEAARGEGIEELAAKVAEHRAFIEQAGTLADRRARNLRSEVLGIATARLRRRLEATIHDDPAVADLLERVVNRELDPSTAAAQLLEGEIDV
jgi:LAO/AO transport system kinase